MEPGTALAVLAMVKPTARTIIELWQDTAHFGSDIRSLSNRFTASKSHLEHYENILFTNNKFPGVTGMLYDTLPENERLTIFDMLGQLRLLFDTYVAASKRYALGRDQTSDKVDSDQTRVERDTVLSATANAKDEEQAKAVGWMKKTWWVVWEKKIVEKLVRDFEKWIKRLRRLMKLVWGPLPFLTSLSQLQNVEKDHDAEKVGLLEDVPLRKLIVAPSDTQILNVGSLKTPPSAFTPSQSHPGYGTFQQTTKVLVEYKPYDVNQINVIHEISSNRISRLIALLHEVKDARFKVLRCISYFDESPQRRMGLLFELPPKLDGPPSTLLSTLSNTSSSSSARPSLDSRMRLARSLCETLLLLHSVNWLHKNIRSETILLLSEAPTTSSPASLGPPNLEHSRLSGFEYSRLDDDFTAGNPDYELHRNIYRHPQRWDQPNESFSKIHDIYSLGVVLLETGVWEPIQNFDAKKGGKPLNERYKNSTTTTSRLMRHATKRLGFHAGEKYQGLVLKCLKGDFGDLSGDDKIGTQLQRELGKGVDAALKDDKKSDTDILGSMISNTGLESGESSNAE
ncbi:MAG: hypothetical protein Q9169_004466 [Polycauliona sp. 2 TL-2023]